MDQEERFQWLRLNLDQNRTRKYDAENVTVTVTVKKDGRREGRCRSHVVIKTCRKKEDRTEKRYVKQNERV